MIKRKQQNTERNMITQMNRLGETILKEETEDVLRRSETKIAIATVPVWHLPLLY
jgi:hypothetical protein